jgi:predicted RNase H-like nuclease (RuvC/YqgF family)
LKALRKTYNEQHELDQIRLQSLLEGKLSEIDQLKKENEVINDQLEQMRKESDELKKKLDGYEKVNNLTGNINMDTSARDNEIMQLEAKLVSVFFFETLKCSDIVFLGLALLLLKSQRHGNLRNVKKIHLQKSRNEEMTKAN